MTRGAWVGLAAIVFMFAEPWLKRWLDHRPRDHTPDQPPAHQTPTQVRVLRPGRELERWDQRWDR